MRVAILADFPIHVIPRFETAVAPGHFPTWLPQLAGAFGEHCRANPATEIHWITVSKRIAASQILNWQNQRFHFLATTERLRMLKFYRRDLAMIAGKLREIQPDIVHGWGTEEVYGLAAIRSGLPAILSMQGILTHYILKNWMHPLVYWQAAIEWFVLKKARFITVESDWGCAIIRSLAPHARLAKVEYGVRELFYDIQWNPDPAKPAALFVGSIHPRKGVQDIVTAFSNPALDGVEVWIAGDGDPAFTRKLRQHSGANIKWMGRLNAADTAALMAHAWCLVLPTRADTSPNVVKEARVIGLPVVTTPCGGQSDYIEDGANGWLVAPGDIAALADRLARTLADLGAARTLGAHRHAEQREWFRPQHTADKFLAIYRELAG